MLRSLGYEPELRRRMSAFSNFAISLSIICILAGGITSFHVGLGSVGGPSSGPSGCPEPKSTQKSRCFRCADG
jgi:hypothetical protein